MAYFKNDEKSITKITIENYDMKSSWEIPHSDFSLDEILNAIVGLLVTIGYNERVVVGAMKEFADQSCEFYRENDEYGCQSSRD